MPKKQTQSYRLWVEAIKALRKVERTAKLEPNISKTILYLISFYNDHRTAKDLS